MATRKRPEKKLDRPSTWVDKIEDAGLRERVREMASQPVGSPMPKLSREEAIQIVRAGIGGRPDLPTGKEFVRQVGWIWRGLVPRGRHRS
jgi:hypothetical protein